MNIKHAPIFNTEEVCKRYSEKDGIEVTYVCTTDLVASDVPVDVFFRETPHPQFGNRYFGLYYDHIRDHVMITNADMVEELQFGMINDKDDQWWYSASHHDCIFVDEGNKMIDGGRVYIRSSGGATVFRVKDGQFVKEAE